MDKDKPTFSFDQLPSAVYELRGKVDALTQFITERFTPEASSGVATEEVMTIEKTAELLNVTVPTVRTMVSDRRIPFSKPANAKLYFLRSEIIQWIKDNRTPTTAEKAIQYETTRRGGRRAA